MDKELAQAIDDGRLLVSREQLPRLLATLAELEREARALGYEFRWDDENVHVEIQVGDDAYAIRVEEETTKRIVVDDTVEVKYDWQRVPQVERKVFSGRLRMTIIQGKWQNPWWADRIRGTLEEKLPELLAAITSAADAARTKRESLRHENERIARMWDEVVPKAKAEYARQINLRRADEQVAAWIRAKALRDYAAAISESVEWASWIRAEADAIDPTYNSTELAIREPDKFPASEVDRFMPFGWTILTPPSPRTF